MSTRIRNKFSFHRSPGNFTDYDDYDEVYGRSVDDDCCISPTDASQFLYNRNQPQGNLDNFLVREDDEQPNTGALKLPEMDEESKVKLVSCLDEVRNIVGDAATDQQIVDALLKFDMDMAAALDNILKATANAAAATSKGPTVLLPPEKGN